MRKSLFLAAAGATVILTGCQQNSVMGQRHYIPAPADEEPAVAEESVTKMAPAAEPAAAVKPAAPAYEPMTGVKSSGGFDTVAAGRAAAVSGKSGSYIVKRGDTPERIARKCGVRLSALMAANNLDDAAARKLRVGQKLVIPDGKSAAAPAAKKSVKKSARSAAAGTAAAAFSADGNYIVKPGDTPERIARRCKVKLSDLLSANKLDESSARRLQVGQKLVIPGASAAAAVPAAPVPAAPAVAPAAETTAVGSEVAGATPVPVESTSAADSMVTPESEDSAVVSDSSSDVEAVEVSADMTLSDFAAKQGVSVEVLRGLNHDKGDKLVKGDWIFVPSKK